MAVNKERVRLLVDALRSGEFDQGFGSLKMDGKYCCLGVACEVAMRNGVVVEVSPHMANPRKTRFDGMSDFMPRRVWEWYGFEEGNPAISRNPEHHGCGIKDCADLTLASSANDDLKWNFSQIADAFEEMYLGEDHDR